MPQVGDGDGWAIGTARLHISLYSGMHTLGIYV